MRVEEQRPLSADFGFLLTVRWIFLVMIQRSKLIPTLQNQGKGTSQVLR